MVGDLQRLQDISQELSHAIERPSVLPEKSMDYLAEVCPLATATGVQGSYIPSLCLYMFSFVYMCFRFSITWLVKIPD